MSNKRKEITKLTQAISLLWERKSKHEFQTLIQTVKSPQVLRKVWYQVHIEDLSKSRFIAYKQCITSRLHDLGATL